MGQLRLYLAYGSNLSKAQMAQRCPEATPLEAITLQGYRLAFVGHSLRWNGGVATLVEDPKASTRAALYALTSDDERSLDGFEGVPGFYRKVEAVFSFKGQAAFTYICNVTSVYPPSRAYLDTIRQGYLDWGFATSLLAGIDTAD
jgi:hypothetical protein